MRRGWRVLAVGTAAALLLAAWWWPGEAPQPAPAAATPRPIAVPVATAPSQSDGPPPAPPTPRRASKPTYWELCGVGRVPVPRGAPEPDTSGGALVALPEHLGRQAHDLVLERTLAALRQGTARDQAVAWLWAEYAAGTQGVSALASRTGDATALQWALQRCSAQQATACAELAPDALARAEPDNLTGWLIWAARRPQDEALWAPGALAARRYTLHWGRVPHALLAAMPSDVPSYLSVFLAIEGIGMQAALPDATGQTAHRLCKTPLPEARAPLGTHMAQVMAQASDTLIGQMIGARLGDSAGWPEERKAAVRRANNEILAAAGSLHAVLMLGEQPLDCTGSQRWRTWVEALVTQGEAQAALEFGRAAAAASAPR